MTIAADIITQIATKYEHFGQADFQALCGDEDAEAILITHIRALAASALGQHEGLGMEVSLIDVFSAWGEREARDTALLIDLCLGAAIEQLVPMTVNGDLWPAEVEIKAASMERLADSGRIVRLQPEVNVWRVRLEPAKGGNPMNEEWGKLGWIRRHIVAFKDYHDISYCEAEAADYADCLPWHEERIDLGAALLQVLDNYGGKQDEPRALVPGEKAPEENPPEKRIDDQPLQDGNSEASGDRA